MPYLKKRLISSPGPVRGARGMFTRNMLKPIGTRRRGSKSFFIARYIKKKPTSHIKTWPTVRCSTPVLIIIE
jgi:hypothetical protein